MTKKWRKVFDEIGDQISSETYTAIRHIDRNEAKIASLDAIVENMRTAEENATFQLVSSLPSSGKADVYYIVLNTTSNKYEEYVWDATSFSKVGLIADAVPPNLVLISVYHAVDKTGSGYSEANPSTEGWWEGVGTQNTRQTDDTATFVLVYNAVDSTQAGYSSMNPHDLGWYKSDGNDGYEAADETSPENDVVYYTVSQDTSKTYYTVDENYAEIPSTNANYSEMNPKHLDWYESNDGGETFTATTDMSPANGKKYYLAIG